MMRKFICVNWDKIRSYKNFCTKTLASGLSAYFRLL